MGQSVQGLRKLQVPKGRRELHKSPHSSHPCLFFSFHTSSRVSTVDPESTDLLDRAHSLAL